MLIQNSFLDSFEPALYHESDHGRKPFIYDWFPATGQRQMCCKCDEDCYSCHREAVLVIEGKKNADFSCPLKFTSSQHSTVSTMSEHTAPNFVYRRRKLQRDSIAIFSAHDPVNMKRSDDRLSLISSNALSLATKEQHVSQADGESEAIGIPVRPPVTTHCDPSHLRADSVQEEHVSDGAAKGSKQKNVEVDSINDSCSSSKSNSQLVSASKKTKVDDAGECSSSSVIALEVMGKDLSEKDLCISILKSEGLLERFRPTQIWPSTNGMDSNNSRCFQSCKICSLSETTLQMLICDNCEEAFHVSCCNPRVREIPIDEWFCHSCSIKKCKIPKETAIKKSSNIISEVGRYRDASSKGESSPIELMLTDTEPYTTGVRIGKGFQADVPDWLGPINNDDIMDEALELNPSESINLHELNCKNPSKLPSIGNWLQCRQVIEGPGEGDDGTICGKWRRAPLFEVQTDDWECFCSVQWNPIHADCAVPQELEMDQILKQLKYIEMLKPRLAAKRRKLNSLSSGGSQDKDVTDK